MGRPPSAQGSEHSDRQKHKIAKQLVEECAETPPLALLSDFGKHPTGVVNEQGTH